MAAQASVQAERSSRSHWTLVYLMNHPNSVWEAVVLDRKGNRATVVIPDLALETQVAIKADAQPNDRISLTLGQIKLPELEVNFRQF
jgi:exoribonuclease-2